MKKPGKRSSHMILYGKNSVFERINARPESIKKIVLGEDFDDSAILKAIKDKSLSFERVSVKKLAKLKHAKDLQKIIAYIDSFTYASLEDLLDVEENRPNIIFLDRINDPQNLGVIIRTAACLGRFAVVIPAHQACCVTEAVLHVASGGENYVPVALVSNLSNALITVKKAGYWIIGAVVDDGAKELWGIDLPPPLAIVMGSEAKGLRYGILKHIDVKARINMAGAPLSLNVAMATAIFCYELSKKIKR
ncbi:MAG: 23S rRNA (guanosine(2251)-2'-O)-methyltransferase RlmB [Candidatus Omnitrophota bacterium]